MSRRSDFSRTVRNVRTEELLGERGPERSRAVRMGELDGIIRQTLVLARREAILEARKAAKEVESLYGVTSFAVADVLVPQSRNQANPLAILSETVAGFEEGGFIATFEGFMDNTHVINSFGNIRLTIGGTEAARMRLGVYTAAVEGAGGMIPFSLTGVFNTLDVAPTIEVTAFASNWDDEATADAGYYIRQGRLVISGAQ